MKTLAISISLVALLLASPVLAGDKNWIGTYVGAHVGGAWGNTSVKDTDGGVAPGPFKYDPSGAFGGVTAGYNYQIGNIVLGLEGDLGYMDLAGASTLPSSNPVYHQNITLDGGVYGDVTGRVGFAFDKALIYGKGGFAFYDGEALQATTKAYYDKTGTDTFTGFVVGGGLEYALTQNVSVKVEYLHFGFGDQGGSQTKARDGGEADDGTLIGDTFHNRTSLSAETVKVGLNYKF